MFNYREEAERASDWCSSHRTHRLSKKKVCKPCYAKGAALSWFTGLVTGLVVGFAVGGMFAAISLWAR